MEYILKSKGEPQPLYYDKYLHRLTTDIATATIFKSWYDAQNFLIGNTLVKFYEVIEYSKPKIINYMKKITQSHVKTINNIIHGANRELYNCDFLNYCQSIGKVHETVSEETYLKMITEIEKFNKSKLN